MDITNLIQTYQIEYNESNDDNFEITFYIDFVLNNFEFDSSYDSVQDFLIDSFIEYDSYINSIDPCPSGDYNDCYGNGGGGGSSTSGTASNQDNLQTWYLDYDGDDYHSAIYRSIDSPGEKWKPYSYGEDCDDTRSQYTTDCCTKSCDIWFKLNLDNCECEALDPCLINKDLRHKKVSDYVKNLIDLRVKTVFMNGSYVDVKLFEIQEIEDGWGDINLDKYALNITNLPNGYQPQMLFEEIRRNFSDFVTGGNLPGFSVELEPYSTADGTKWNSSNPIGAAIDFDNNFDTSTVICTEYNYDEMYWTFTTVHSLDHQGHFVSGHRQFGIEANSDGSYSFYLRGADRLGQFADYVANNFTPGKKDFLFNEAADATWKNLMSNLEKFINSKTGSKVKPFDKNKDYAHRFPYNEADCPE